MQNTKLNMKQVSFVAAVTISLVFGLLLAPNSVHAQRGRTGPDLAPNAQLIVDGGFEAGSPWPGWTVQTSTAFGNSICNTTLCSTNGGLTGPRTGINWNWFGGGTGGQIEDSTTGQSIVIPAGGAMLSFWMRIQQVTTPFTDTVIVEIDGVAVQTYTEPATGEAAYTQRLINLSAFANGASHTVVFRYHSVDGATNFLIDDIAVNTVTAAGVTVGGRVVTGDGRGVRNAVVQISDQNGMVRTATTGLNGRYSFEDIEPGRTYVMSVRSRRFWFSPRILQLTDSIADVDFASE